MHKTFFIEKKQLLQASSSSCYVLRSYRRRPYPCWRATIRASGLGDYPLRDPELKATYNTLEPEYKLAESLIKARHAMKWTQEELATKAGVTQNTITRLESGTTNPTFGTLSRVASALGKELRLVGAH